MWRTSRPAWTRPRTTRNSRIARLDFPILSDPGKQVASAYGVVTPERQFAQRWTYYIGVDGKILFVDKKVSTATAGQDLARSSVNWVSQGRSDTVASIVR